MNKEEKIKFVEDLKGRLEKAQGTFLIDYQGLNVESINRLRNQLRKVGAEFQVVKNRLLKLSSRETGTGMIEGHMQGPSAITLTYDDVIGPAKVLVDFTREFKSIRIKCGQISGKVVDEKAIERLAELPGKDELLAQTLSTMQAVPASFLRVLNGVIVKLLNVLRAIEQEKEK